MNKLMIKIVALINAATQRIETNRHYTKKFEVAGNEYTSPTEELRIDAAINHFIVAGIVGRKESLPILGRDKFMKINVNPDIVGGEFPYSGDDLLVLQAGMPQYTRTGEIINSLEALRAKYSKMAAAAISNKKERQNVDCYLKGIYRDKSGAEHEIGVTTDLPLDLTGEIVSDHIIKLANEWAVKKGEAPRIEFGLDGFNAIKNEALNAAQNINNVAYITDATTGEGYLQVGPYRVYLLFDGVGTDGNVIDTSKMLILSDPKTLATGYAGLKFGDIKTDQPVLFEGKLVAGETTVTVQSAEKGLWAKSAPMPLVIDVKKFVRYTVTLPVRGGAPLQVRSLSPENSGGAEILPSETLQALGIKSADEAIEMIVKSLDISKKNEKLVDELKDKDAVISSQKNKIEKIEKGK